MLALLIDNSNGHTKFALGDEQQLHSWRGVLPTKDLSRQTLQSLLIGQKFDAVCVASVVPDKALVLEDFFKAYLFHLVQSESPLGYGFAIPKPSQVGADRLANVTALKEKWGFPAIAVDFGTAVTFSVLSEQGYFLGGVIAPGLGGITQYLFEKGAQLPEIQIKEPLSVIGQNTQDALLSGAVYGHRGMIREILRKIVSELAFEPIVVATGSGAEFATRGLSEFHAMDINLTLEGIRLIGMRKFLGLSLF